MVLTRRELLKHATILGGSTALAVALATRRRYTSTAWAAQSSQAGRTLRFAQTADIVTLNPAHISQAGDRNIAQNLFNGLLRFRSGGKSLQVEPSLAESYQRSADAKTWTFRLRKGVQWHEDFGEFHADDVRFTVEYHQDSTHRSLALPVFAQIDAVDTPDPYTAVLRLKQPAPDFAAQLAFQNGFILCKNAFAKYGTDVEFHPVGTGPYHLAEWVKGDHSVLGAHEKCFEGPAAIPQIMVQVVPEESVAVLALAQGELDSVAILTLAGYRQVKTQRNIKIVSGKGAWVNFAYFHNQRKPVDDPRVRQALAFAADLRGIATKMGGAVDYDPSYLPSIVYGWTPEVTTYSLDVAKANQLLSQAGYGPQAKPQVKMAYSKSFLYEDFAILLQQNWSKIADVSLLELPVPEQYPDIISGKGDWNVALGGLTRFSPSDYNLYFDSHNMDVVNFPHWANSHADALIQAVAMEANETQRKGEIATLQALLADQVPALNVGVQNSIVATGPNLTGIAPYPFPGVVEFRGASFV